MGHIEFSIFKNILCLKIQNTRPPKWALIFPLIIAVFMIMTPISTILLLKIEITFGAVLICFFSGLISWFFLRLYLWNKYGKEVFYITKNNIETFYDYKFYKDKNELLKYKKLNVLIYTDNGVIKNEKEQVCILGLQIDERAIVSNIKVPVSQALEFRDSLSNFLNIKCNALIGKW